MILPDLTFEHAAYAAGARVVAGVDEVGRGPLAGPVVAAAVILPEKAPDGLNDSKRLSAGKREHLAEEIVATCIVCIASLDARAVDAMNIRAASLAAMRSAVLGLQRRPDHLLVDGNALPQGLEIAMETIIKGDTLSCSIAAASIVAKVARDRTMYRADRIWPGYGFAAHKGYPVPIHKEALARLGPCPLHRTSFAPVRAAMRA